MEFWEVEDCGCCSSLFVLEEWRRRLRRWRQRRGLSNEDIEFLKMELRSIQAALRLVEMVPPELLPQHLKDWANRSREASYDIQDILDTFLVRVEGAHPDASKELLLRKMAHSSLPWREFTDAIIDVKILVHKIAEDRARHTDGFLAADAIRVQQITERLSRYRADTNPVANRVDPSLLDLIKHEGRFIGLYGAMEDVIGRLTGEDHTHTPSPSSHIRGKPKPSMGDDTPGGYFVGRPSNYSNDYFVGPPGKPKPTMEDDTPSTPPGGYFVGRPSNYSNDYFVRPPGKPKPSMEDDTPGGYFVGRPSNYSNDYFVGPPGKPKPTMEDDTPSTPPGGYFVGRPSNCSTDYFVGPPPNPKELKIVCIVGVGGLVKKTLARAVYEKLQPQFHCSAFVSLSRNPNVSKVLRIILQQLDNGEHISEAAGKWDVRQLVDQLRQLLQNKRYIIVVDNISDGKLWEKIRSAVAVENNLRSRIMTTTEMPEVAGQVGGAYKLDLPNDHSVCTLRNILVHSYYQLPSHLRPCFLYVSMFPEDYEFRRDRLVWRWIAEGFIEGKEGCSLFQIGSKYMDELLNRSLIVEVNKDNVLDGMAKYCHVHHMVLDLSCSLARDENFITKLVDEQEEHVEDKVRWLSVQSSHLGRRAHTLRVGQHVRSVGAFGTGINLMPPLSSFHILRVLDLEGCDLTGSYYDPKHLGKLFHLRYLGLRATNALRLPRDIGNLRFLQVLDLKGTRIREVPSTFVLLHKLMCLYAEPETRIPKGMGNLKSLEELTKISVSESPSLMEELTSFVELRVLDIMLQPDMSESSQRYFAESLSKMQKLQTLRIFGSCMAVGWAPPPSLRRFVTVGAWFSVLPTWISTAHNLLELQIGVRELWREGVHSVGRLQELEILRLAVERMMGERLAADADAFPNLTQLELSAETCLVFPQGGMPKLQVLKFDLDVDKANGDFNWGLSNLPRLHKVSVNLGISNNSTSTNKEKEARAALRRAVCSDPNRRIELEITRIIVSQQQDVDKAD